MAVGWQISWMVGGTHLSGAALADTLRVVGAQVTARVIVLSGVDGGGEATTRLALITDRKHLRHMPAERVYSLVSQMEIVDWGDFFLFRDPTAAASLVPFAPFETEIPKCDALVRAADGGYVYVYGTSDSLATELAAEYPDGEFTRGPLDEFEYME